MFDKETIENIVSQALQDNDYFIVDITVGSDDKITVYIDKFSGNISLDDCQELHKKIYPQIEEHYDNFELNVSSPGLTTPLKVWQQYYKHKGGEIEVLTNDGKNILAKIVDADEQQVVLNAKGKQITLPYSEIKKAKLVLKF